MLNKLKNIVEQTDTRAGRTFDLIVQILILISLISFTIETLPDLPGSLNEILVILEITIVLLFSVEYLLRIIVTEEKFKYIFSFYGILDLLAILPFYITSGIDLRSVRIFRLFRIFRVFKLFRFSTAIARLQRAFTSIKDEILIFILAALFLLYLSAVGIYYFEHVAQPDAFKSIFHSLWWAVATLTTVGYGDIYPITVGGKIFTFFILIIGMGIIAVPAGLIASAFSKTFNDQ
ncbi:MAG: ion transporter [Candidatus Marinimicrobia bacterium]|nr:ion transporter [Candidatus Neomarinimicrobiota bacterium]